MTSQGLDEMSPSDFLIKVCDEVATRHIDVRSSSQSRSWRQGDLGAHFCPPFARLSVAWGRMGLVPVLPFAP